MADFIYVDKENIASQVNFMSRPQTHSISRGIVGKTLDSGTNNVSVEQPVRRALGDVNRKSAYAKSSEVSNHKASMEQFSAVKAWKKMKPAASASKILKSKDQGTHVTVRSEAVNKIENTAVKEEDYEEIENMFPEPSEPETYDDIWAVDYPIMPEETYESSDEDSILSDSDTDSTTFIRDYTLEDLYEEPHLEILPEISDIPLPPLEDLFSDKTDYYSTL